LFDPSGVLVANRAEHSALRNVNNAMT
jgi:hypothetical protein